jgi:hypothetical protein
MACFVSVLIARVFVEGFATVAVMSSINFTHRSDSAIKSD